MWKLLFIGNAIEEDRGVLGIRYLLPLNLETNVFVGTDGAARFVVGKNFELTPRLALFGQAQYDTDTKWEGLTALSYMVLKNLSLIGQWHSDYGFSSGLRIRF